MFNFRVAPNTGEVLYRQVGKVGSYPVTNETMSNNCICVLHVGFTGGGG